MKKSIKGKNRLLVEPKISWIRFLIFSLISIALIAADQLTKLWVVNNDTLINGGRIEIIENLFQLRYAFNSGAAFSFLANVDWGISILTIISILASILFTVMLARFSKWPAVFPLSISLILAGSVGNLIDRVRLDGVIDFLDFYYQDWHFPTFNIADACITVGAAIFFIYFVFFYDRYLVKYNDKLEAEQVLVRELDTEIKVDKEDD